MALYSIYEGVDLRGTVGKVAPGKVDDVDRRRHRLSRLIEDSAGTEDAYHPAGDSL